jgi:hypothetical protein
MSPDFPSVSQALLSLAPAAGQGQFDGVMGVDPQGLAALLELTGPVRVEQWPDEITSQNVVNVTLRDAYAAYADQSPERADFLGDVAQAAVDKATSGTLGKPAQIAKVLGKAAHEGHLTLSFTRPEEQALAEQLGIAQEMAPVHSDAVAVTSSNSVGNKIDFYLKRTLDYRVMLTPENDAREAQAKGDLSVVMDNTAPDTGLPRYVIGPYDNRFVAGQNRSFVSLYSPLNFASASVDGTAADVAPGRERGRNVFSLFTSELSKQQKTVAVKLDGTVKLHHGWYDVVVRNQPSIIPDTVRVSVDVPPGWKIDKAPGMERPFARRASLNNPNFTKTTTYRVHIVRDPGTWDIWDRLEAGV